MTDLLPLACAVLAAVVGVVGLLWLRRLPVGSGAGGVKVGTVVVSALLTVAAYLACQGHSGDPDVWDFYATYWFAPLVVLALVTLGAVVIRPARAQNVTELSAAARERYADVLDRLGQ
ncbi:hypothetical protein SAMN06298212_105100 [Ruaniaceae bacterium KH17]|nr:hypothetical protein SAMN06298212_105100 [Ruaniaceae bacterium KH17]